MDQEYVARAARRRRFLTIIGVLVLLGVCVFFAVNNTFYDRCTGGFDRSANSVVNSYLAAMSRGDLNRVENCWVRTAYYDMKSGCSELCLSRAMGASYTLKKVDLGLPFAAENGRSNIQAVLSLTCPDGTELNGEIVLDAVAGAVPWKHWRIAHSTIGGSAAQPWCK